MHSPDPLEDLPDLPGRQNEFCKPWSGHFPQVLTGTKKIRTAGYRMQKWLGHFDILRFKSWRKYLSSITKLE
jgi:hypothetical protein